MQAGVRSLWWPPTSGRNMTVGMEEGRLRGDRGAHLTVLTRQWQEVPTVSTQQATGRVPWGRGGGQLPPSTFHLALCSPHVTAEALVGPLCSSRDQEAQMRPGSSQARTAHRSFPLAKLEAPLPPACGGPDRLPAQASPHPAGPRVVLVPRAHTHGQHERLSLPGLGWLLGRSCSTSGVPTLFGRCPRWPPC